MQLRSEMPHLAFAEIAEELGRRWRDLTDSEKDRYRTNVSVSSALPGSTVQTGASSAGNSDRRCSQFSTSQRVSSLLVGAPLCSRLLSSSTASTSSRNMDGVTSSTNGVHAPVKRWICARCTLINSASARHCFACESLRTEVLPKVSKPLHNSIPPRSFKSLNKNSVKRHTNRSIRSDDDSSSSDFSSGTSDDSESSDDDKNSDRPLLELVSQRGSSNRQMASEAIRRLDGRKEKLPSSRPVRQSDRRGEGVGKSSAGKADSEALQGGQQASDRCGERSGVPETGNHVLVGDLQLLEVLEQTGLPAYFENMTSEVHHCWCINSVN